MNRNDKQFITQKIRTQYVEPQTTELDTLRALDCKVRRPATIFGYVFGSISALIAGSGMSLVMTDLGAAIGIVAPLVPGIIVGTIGMAMAIATYPIYGRILARRKQKFSKQVLELSDQVLAL